MDVTDVARKIKEYQARFDIEVVVIDNANKQAVMELNNRHDLTLTPADKAGKSDFIEIMNGEFIQERIMLHVGRTQPLQDEYIGLIWDETAAKRAEHPNCPNHCCDAALYAWRYCYSYLANALPAAKPAYGTPEWTQNEVRSMEDREQQELDARLNEQRESVGDSSQWEWQYL